MHHKAEAGHKLAGYISDLSLKISRLVRLFLFDEYL
jgi:hypothetical protein